MIDFVIVAELFIANRTETIMKMEQQVSFSLVSQPFQVHDPEFRPGYPPKTPRPPMKNHGKAGGIWWELL